MVIPIVVRNSVFGHIFVWDVDTPISGFDLSILETASTTMALEILRKLSVREVENRYRTEFLEDLLSLDKARREKAVERSTFFNLSPKDRYMAIVVDIKEKEEETQNIDISSDSAQQDFSKTIETIENLIAKMGLTGIVASKTERMLILLSFKRSVKVEENLDEFSRMAEEVLVQKLETGNFRVGIGRAYDGVEKFYNSYIDGIRAIETGLILNEGSITNFESLGIFKILSQDHLTEELEKFFNTTIKPLVDYDRKKSTELVKTLNAYFQHNGNLKKMSDSLFTHYNTILYRVQRINEITGMNLDNANDRLNLEIALKIKELLKK